MKSEYQKMKEREKRCVCRQCGTKLEARLIIFNQYGGQGIELYCPTCKRIEYGVEPEIYFLARRFVADNEFNYFADMVEDERSFRLNISKVSELFSWAFRELKLCDNNGLTKIGQEVFEARFKTDR